MAAPSTPIVRLDGVTKRFPGGVVANRRVDLALYGGEIHALVGENGAGKSTLMSVLFGLHKPDEGRILVAERPVRHRSPADAIADGIGMVHQHFKLVPSMTVAENLVLGRFRSTGTRLAPRRAAAVVAELSERYGLGVDPKAAAGSLPLAAQQRVEILKALHQQARVLILDEPTTVLNPAETERLYEVLVAMAAEGRAVVLITHHLDEVFRFSDHVSVLRQGELVGEGLTAEMTRDEVARLVVGHELKLGLVRQRGAAEPGRTMLQLNSVSVPGSAFSTGLDGIDLEVRAGEIVAVAGVEGNGQRELFEVVAGLRRPATGEVRAGADGVAPRGRRHSAELGIALVPEDRQAEGLFLDLTIAENLVIDRVSEPPYSRGLALDRRAIGERARDLLQRFDVRATGPDAPARTLSGGNQQKVVLARALRDGARVLLAHQPTRGLDIGATEDLLERLAKTAEDGAAVLFISSNLDEVLRLGDRIVVLYRGRVSGETSGRDASLEQVGRWMTGYRDEAA
jgi:ABC-type uncharacterized transport system ATPase subunit